MQVRYDKKSDSKYVHIKKGVIRHTKKETDWLLFDYSRSGDILGVEILDSSKHPISISTFNGKVFDYHILEPKGFGENVDEALVELRIGSPSVQLA